MKIELNDLHFSYPGKKILHGINLNIKDRKITCIIGPNGSGKSTLVKCLNRLLVPNTGTVLLDGRNLATFTRMDIALNIGYVPQSANLLFTETVFDTVIMGRCPHSSWQYNEEDIDVTASVLSHLNLEDIAFQQFNHLSG
ncbi:MAG: ABC transporter ATP-binding protein, partial [Spirochaetes bacterium]|nr:ABC transporter ATP-binding protein [Spirochaetota bacterium]